jgi:hypothetical protein
MHPVPPVTSTVAPPSRWVEFRPRQAETAPPDAEESGVFGGRLRLRRREFGGELAQAGDLDLDQVRLSRRHRPHHSFVDF